MKKLSNRMLALAMCLCMIFTMMPMAAHATETEHTCDWGEWTFNRDGTHTRVCKTDNTHTETGNCKSYGWIYTEENHAKKWSCEYCGGGYDKDISNNNPYHVYASDTDLTCEYCGYVRTVEGTLSITGDLPAATVGVAYSASFGYTGTVSGVVFWNATGLPDGLTVDYGTGTISGTPTTAGTYEVTVSMGATGGGSASKNFTLTVSEPASTHTHEWSTEWSGTSTYHWHDCTAEGCNLNPVTGDGKDGYAKHEFDLTIDTHYIIEAAGFGRHFGTCKICGRSDSMIIIAATRKSDETYHWYECPCGVEEQFAEHSFDDDADTTCDDCGYERTVGGDTTENGIITLTPADLVDGASGEGWSFDGTQLTIESGYTLIFEGECSVDVVNKGTIESGTFSGKLTNNQGSISGITIELSNALIQGGESYGWSLDADNDLILNSGITYYWKDGEICGYRVENNGTITGGSFGGRVHSWGTITGGTFSDQVDNDGTITDGTFNGVHCFNHKFATITGGTFSSIYVENNGTITGGTFSGNVNNKGTISGGVFTYGMQNPGTVTGTVDLSTLRVFGDHGGQYGKQVKLPKAVIWGDLTYTGCESSTEITLEYYADDVKTAEWTVSGEEYSYPVEGWKRTDPDADLSGIEEITHEVKAVSMDGYGITIDNPRWDRFHVTVTHTAEWTGWVSNGDGTHRRTCSDETHTHTETAPCAGGTATCTDRAICTDCGTAYGNLAEHTYGNWKVVKAATTTAKGKEQRTCSACGHVESRDIPMISDVPQTGDESNLLMWGAVMLVSVLGMVALLAESKRRRSTK